MPPSLTSPMHRFANPAQFLRIARVMRPLAALIALACGTLGLYLGLFASPADYQQGETVRIMYLHVPAAILASGVYGFMALMSASFLIWRHGLADVLSREAAPIGAVFALITLITGMLWGKPTWGTYWVWDARLTSVLILLLLYLGYIAITSAQQITESVKVAAAWVALIGAINLPIIKYSVEWWNTLHQSQSLRLIGESSIDPSMLRPLQCMIVAFTALALWLLLTRTQASLAEIKQRRLQIPRVTLKNAASE